MIPREIELSPDRDRVRYYRRHAVAERDFLDHAKEETGRGMSAEDWERNVSNRTRVRQQTDAIAARLEFGGKLAWRKTAYGLARWWVQSRTLEEIPQYRRMCILPYMAAIIRAPRLAALEFFLQRHRQARFWTFTSGSRVGLDGLRKRCRYLHRKLSKLSAFLRERYGVELVFRSTEFGTVEFDAQGNELDGGEIEFGADGEPLFHVHAHCVVNSLVGFIKPERWDQMIADVREFWGHHWDAGGVIRDARECCKYVTKPGDILKLSPEQLGRFHEAVFRAKLCQPMGRLAEEMRERKKAKKTLRRYRRKDGKGSIWREVFNHNEQTPTTPEERELADNLADAEAFAEELRFSARVEVESAPEAKETRSVWALKDEAGDWQSVPVVERNGGFWAGTEYAQPDQEKEFCRVLSRLSPTVGPSGRKEPAVVVSFSRFDQTKVEKHPLVSRLWAETVQMWEEGLGADHGAGPIRVHTVTPTVPARPSYSPPRRDVDASESPPCPFEGV